MSAIYRNGKWYGKDNGHIIMNNAGLELKPRATLQFGGDLSTTDDNTNERTVIKPHEISSEEWDDIVTLLPGGVPNNGVVIDTRGNEYIVGKYIELDGTIKPIYQRTFVIPGSELTLQGPSPRQYWTKELPLTAVDAVLESKGWYSIAGSWGAMNVVTSTAMEQALSASGFTGISVSVTFDVSKNLSTGAVSVVLGTNVDRHFTANDINIVVAVQYTKTTD